MSNTYIERVNRYVIERHEELPEEHKAAYRLEGINPDDLWSLIWSFETKEAAEKMLAEEEADAPKFWTYRMRDLGGPIEIERQMWF